MPALVRVRVTARVGRAMDVADIAATVVANSKITLRASTGMGAVPLLAAFANAAIAFHFLEAGWASALLDLVNDLSRAELWLCGDHCVLLSVIYGSPSLFRANHRIPPFLCDWLRNEGGLFLSSLSS